MKYSNNQFGFSPVFVGIIVAVVVIIIIVVLLLMGDNGGKKATSDVNLLNTAPKTPKQVKNNTSSTTRKNIKSPDQKGEAGKFNPRALEVGDRVGPLVVTKASEYKKLPGVFNDYFKGSIVVSGKVVAFPYPNPAPGIKAEYADAVIFDITKASGTGISAAILFQNDKFAKNELDIGDWAKIKISNLHLSVKPAPGIFNSATLDKIIMIDNSNALNKKSLSQTNKKDQLVQSDIVKKINCQNNTKADDKKTNFYEVMSDSNTSFRMQLCDGTFLKLNSKKESQLFGLGPLELGYWVGKIEVNPGGSFHICQPGYLPAHEGGIYSCTNLNGAVKITVLKSTENYIIFILSDAKMQIEQKDVSKNKTNIKLPIRVLGPDNIYAKLIGWKQNGNDGIGWGYGFNIGKTASSCHVSNVYGGGGKRTWIPSPKRTKPISTDTYECDGVKYKIKFYGPIPNGSHDVFEITLSDN